eukprot:gene34345-38822_t
MSSNPYRTSGGNDPYQTYMSSGNGSTGASARPTSAGATRSRSGSGSFGGYARHNTGNSNLANMASNTSGNGSNGYATSNTSNIAGGGLTGQGYAAPTSSSQRPSSAGHSLTIRPVLLTILTPALRRVLP